MLKKSWRRPEKDHPSVASGGVRLVVQKHAGNACSRLRLKNLIPAYQTAHLYEKSRNEDPESRRIVVHFQDIKS
jgi:hypothetical protein